MFEWFKEAIKSLNDYAGLFSLLAVLAAVYVPYVIYKKERKNEKQAMQNELDAMEHSSHFPMSMKRREYYTKKQILEKQLDRE